MYIFELITELKKRQREKTAKAQTAPQEVFRPEEAPCSHIFVPIDSLKENLACRKCGFMVKKSGLRKKESVFN